MEGLSSVVLRPSFSGDGDEVTSTVFFGVAPPPAPVSGQGGVSDGATCLEFEELGGNLVLDCDDDSDIFCAALCCPCILYGNTMGLLRGSDSCISSIACLFFPCLACITRAEVQTTTGCRSQSASRFADVYREK